MIYKKLGRFGDVFDLDLVKSSHRLLGLTKNSFYLSVNINTVICSPCTAWEIKETAYW